MVEKKPYRKATFGNVFGHGQKLANDVSGFRASFDPRVYKTDQHPVALMAMQGERGKGTVPRETTAQDLLREATLLQRRIPTMTS